MNISEAAKKIISYSGGDSWQGKAEEYIQKAIDAETAAKDAEIARLKSEAAKWEALHDELADAIMFEVKRDSYGPTETDAEAIKRVVAERDRLKERDGEYINQLSIDDCDRKRLLTNKAELVEALKKAAKIFPNESPDGMDAAEYVDSCNDIWNAIYAAREALKKVGAE